MGTLFPSEAVFYFWLAVECTYVLGVLIYCLCHCLQKPCTFPPIEDVEA